MAFYNFRNWRPDALSSGLVYMGVRLEVLRTLRDLPVGSRLIYRSKTDWRYAVVSRRTADKAVLIVCSPTGRTYRLSRILDSEIEKDGSIPILRHDANEEWRENFADYDRRW